MGIGSNVKSSINYLMEEGEGEDVMDTTGRKLWGACPQNQSWKPDGWDRAPVSAEEPLGAEIKVLQPMQGWTYALHHRALPFQATAQGLPRSWGKMQTAMATGIENKVDVAHKFILNLSSPCLFPGAFLCFPEAHHHNRRSYWGHIGPWAPPPAGLVGCKCTK